MVLTVASWPAHWFLRKQVRWSGIPTSLRFFQFVVNLTVKGFLVVNEAEVNIFLKLLCFLHDPTNVGNLISVPLPLWNPTCTSGSSRFIYCWSLKDFEHDSASMWNECNCMVVWTFFAIALLWDLNKNWHFPVLWPLWSFPNCWHIECSTFTASSFRIWNSSAGIPSPPLALFIVMPPKAHWTSYFRMSGSRWVITPSWLLGH